jgi:hypothetical protein
LDSEPWLSRLRFRRVVRRRRSQLHDVGVGEAATHPPRAAGARSAVVDHPDAHAVLMLALTSFAASPSGSLALATAGS